LVNSALSITVMEGCSFRCVGAQFLEHPAHRKTTVFARRGTRNFSKAVDMFRQSLSSVYFSAGACLK
jgi:hypothetical protein